MAADFENLSIRISASAKDAINKVNQLADALKSLNEQLASIDPSKMSRVASAAQDFGSAVKGMGSKKAAKDIEAVANGMSQITNSASGITQVANAHEQLAQATEHMADASKDATQSAGGNATNGMQNLTAASKQAENVIKALSAGWGGFTGTLKKAGSIFGNVAKKTLSSAMGLKKLSNGMNVAKNSAVKFVKELTRIGKMLKLMVTRMVLRQIISGIGDGFKNLAQYSKTFNANISLLWNSFRQLGNSIAAAVSPLLNALAPALNYIIQLAVSAANAINQLVSALLGLGTWTRAKTLTDSYADSLKKAGGAAKDLKKTVLGFDELNQLQDNKSGGGGGATDPSDMFEEVGLSDYWKKISDWIKSMWKKADFTELGKMLGEKLLAGLKKIPWSKIKVYARKVGKSLATLINGFIEVEDLGRTIGETIAQAINTGFEFVNSFVHNFHWGSLGRFIADTFNGFFETIDWGLIKDTVVTGLKGLADSINEFVQTFHWDDISSFVVNALDVISSGILNFFGTVDWSKLGTKLGEQLAKVIKETDWTQVGQAIGSFIQGAIDFASSLISQLSWEDIKDAIRKVAEGFFEKVDKDKLGGIVKTILGYAIAIGIGKIVIETAKIALAEKIKSVITNAASSQAVQTAANTAGGKIGESMFTGIEGAIFNLGASLQPLEFLMKVFGEDRAKEIRTWSDEVQNGAMSVDEFTQKVRETADPVDKAIMGWEDMGTTVETESYDMQEAYSQAAFSMQGSMETLEKTTKDTTDSIKKSFDKKEWTFSGIADGLSASFESAKNAVKSIWNSIADSMNGTHSFFGSSFSINLPHIFASGGFPEDGLFMANHNELVGRFSNGRTAVANNEQITAGIAQAVYSAMISANSGGGGQYINNTIEIDGVAIARAVTKGQRSIDRRYNPTMA